MSNLISRYELTAWWYLFQKHIVPLHCSANWDEVRGMGDWAIDKVLAFKNGDLSLNLPNQHKNLRIVVYACNARAGEAETGASLGLSGQSTPMRDLYQRMTPSSFHTLVHSHTHERWSTHTFKKKVVRKPPPLTFWDIGITVYTNTTHFVAFCATSGQRLQESQFYKYKWQKVLAVSSSC